MKNKKIVLAILASIIGLSQATAQSNLATNTTKATAQLVSSCQIQAQAVNFGSLILPLTTQTVTSNLNVLCNKGANYTIDMTYGGIYGKGYPGSLVYNVLTTLCSPGVPLVLSYNVVGGGGNIVDSYCGMPSIATRAADGKYYSGAPVTYNYGKMIGAGKGDNIAYSLEVPNKSGTVWNTTNKYTAVGTGVTESIPVKATLVPNQSGGLYPIPDMYSDTVTTKITF